MSDLRMFRMGKKVEELASSRFDLEKKLQNLLEENMQTVFGVRFLASEYVIDQGRMDSLGIDENNAPVVFEYKRSKDENVMSQGLFYLTWLMDHKDSFKLLVMEKYSKEIASAIDWDGARVICVANDFTNYDQGAIKQMNVNIALYRYRVFGKDLLYLERLGENDVTEKKARTLSSSRHSSNDYSQLTFVSKISKASKSIRDLFVDVENYIRSLGDDITVAQLKYYKAFKKIANFVCVEVYQQSVILHLKLDVKTVAFEKGFSRDVTKIGHYGTGNVEIALRTSADFEKAKQYIRRAYEEC